jgi:hypothetical protein
MPEVSISDRIGVASCGRRVQLIQRILGIVARLITGLAGLTCHLSTLFATDPRIGPVSLFHQPSCQPTRRAGWKGRFNEFP